MGTGPQVDPVPWHSMGNAFGEATALVDLGFIPCRTGQQADADQRLQEALAVAQAAASARYLSP